MSTDNHRETRRHRQQVEVEPSSDGNGSKFDYNVLYVVIPLGIIGLFALLISWVVRNPSASNIFFNIALGSLYVAFAFFVSEWLFGGR